MPKREPYYVQAPPRPMLSVRGRIMVDGAEQIVVTDSGLVRLRGSQRIKGAKIGDQVEVPAEWIGRGQKTRGLK
jgi:hypothetical protein